MHYPSFTHPGGPEAIAPRIAATARVAEAVGATDFTVMDHWFQMEQLHSVEDPMLEGYTTFGYLAGRTERITLGLLVTGVTYRHPGLLGGPAPPFPQRSPGYRREFAAGTGRLPR
ncbi:MAG: LLM class flavin-dependent oxidoreductase [Nocardioides sp.]